MSSLANDDRENYSKIILQKEMFINIGGWNNNKDRSPNNFDISKWKERQLAEKERIRHLDRTPEPPQRPPKKPDHQAPYKLPLHVHKPNIKAAANIANLAPRPFSGITGLKKKIKPVVPPKPVLDPQTKTLINTRLKSSETNLKYLPQTSETFTNGLNSQNCASGTNGLHNSLVDSCPNGFTNHVGVNSDTFPNGLKIKTDNSFSSGLNQPNLAIPQNNSKISDIHPNCTQSDNSEAASTYTNCKPVPSFVSNATYQHCDPNDNLPPADLLQHSQLPTADYPGQLFNDNLPPADLLQHSQLPTADYSGQLFNENIPDYPGQLFNENLLPADDPRFGHFGPGLLRDEPGPGSERARLVRVDSQLSDYSLYQQISPQISEEPPNFHSRIDLQRPTKYEKTVYNSGLQKLTIVKSKKESEKSNGLAAKEHDRGAKGAKEGLIAQELERAKDQKDGLIARIANKIHILREEREHVQSELNQNEAIAQEILERLDGLARIRDIDRIRRHMEEVETLTSLILGLSCRLARLEADPQVDAGKQSKLRSQLEEAKELQELSLSRRFNLKSIIAGHLDELAGHSFLVYVDEKARLIMESRELEDKIKLAETQVNSLKQI